MPGPIAACAIFLAYPDLRQNEIRVKAFRNRGIRRSRGIPARSSPLDSEITRATTDPDGDQIESANAPICGNEADQTRVRDKDFRQP